MPRPEARRSPQPMASVVDRAANGVCGRNIGRRSKRGTLLNEGRLTADICG